MQRKHWMMNLSLWEEDLDVTFHPLLDAERRWIYLSKVSLPDSISVLDLHSNKLYGSTEKLFSDNISYSCPSLGGCLEFINLANNEITGRILEINGEHIIKWLDLSVNCLKGSVPTSISMLKKNECLDFSRNWTVDKIPRPMGELKELRWLDLSWNGFKGKIPGHMLGLKHLKHMNLRNNRLYGQIPQVKPLTVFPASAYAHNDCLYGSSFLQEPKALIMVAFKQKLISGSGTMSHCNWYSLF